MALIPYLFVLYIVAYMDRVNVGFAAMDMKRQLHFTDTVYGTALESSSWDTRCSICQAA